MEQQKARAGRFKESTAIGIVFLVVGGIWLLRLAGFPLPSWLFTWEMILIGLGIFTGIRNGFRDFSWLVFILVGGVFMLDNIWPDLTFRKYMWPAIIITLGLVFIFAPKGPCKSHRRRSRPPQYGSSQDAVATTREEYEFDNTLETALDIVSIFGGVTKKVLSKQFVGGDVVCIFGGAQINLANADFKSPIVLDLVQIFGGTKLVVPANWEIRSEIAAIFGGVDDKRPQPANAIPEKTVILKGTIIFGGVEVNSF